MELIIDLMNEINIEKDSTREEKLGMKEIFNT